MYPMGMSTLPMTDTKDFVPLLHFSNEPFPKEVFSHDSNPQLSNYCGVHDYTNL